MSTTPAPTGVRRLRSAAALTALGLAATAAAVVPSIADSDDAAGIRAADESARPVLEAPLVPETVTSAPMSTPG